MLPRIPVRPWLISSALAILLVSPAHALFDNTCLIFNVASRDHPMKKSWLADSLFDLSTKKMSATQIRNLKYSVTEDEAMVEVEPNEKLTYFLVDGEIRFIDPNGQVSHPVSAQPTRSAEKKDEATSDAKEEPAK